MRSNLRRIMARKGMTYRALAERSGVSGETINRARGALIAECRLSTLVALARALDVRVKDLFDEEAPGGEDVARG